MSFQGLIRFCAVSVLLCATAGAQVEVRRAIPVARAEETRASDNDLARFIAGIRPPPGSPLASLAATSEWNAYAAYMNERWQVFDAGRLQPIRRWRATAMAGVTPSTVFYPFSGPDYIYARTFFPGATRYILCGLEPVGAPPSTGKLVPLAQSLGWLQSSFKTLLEAGYFVTKDMRVNLKMSPLQGTIPILCVMLARSGDRIVSIEYDRNHAVIHFARSDSGQPSTLEYYCVNLSDDGLGKGNASFVNYIKRSKPGVAYIKSASYLMHESEFSTIRDLLLSQCPVIVQDDSGIPVRYFDPNRWNLRLFGTYDPPLAIFKKYYQADMAELYRKTTPAPLGFGAGYHWNPKTANLIIGTRK